MSRFNIQRRMLLRGAVALGSTLCLQAMATPVMKPSRPVEPTGDPKVSQEQAKYQDLPKGKQRCANCEHFVVPNTCQLVDGTVSADGWCTIWTRKAA